MGLRKLTLSKKRRLESKVDSCNEKCATDQSYKETTESVASDSHQAGRRRLDHVLSAALVRGALSQAQLDSLGSKHSGSDAAVTWRQFTLAFPETGEPLYELAAEIYGFRSATVCQIATLIYNHKLTEFFSNTDWNRLFERGVVPVVEFLKYPKVVRHHFLASSDPGSRYVRSLQHELPLSHTELVFVPKSGIHKLQNLLSVNIPVLKINPFIMHRMSPANQPDIFHEFYGKRAA